MVVPITDKSYEYGQQVRSMIRKAGIHCDVDVSNNKMQKKVRTCSMVNECGYRFPTNGTLSSDFIPSRLYIQVREAQLSQYNYILVVGEQEQREGNVNVRTRDNIVHGMHSIADLVRTLKDERDSRSLTSKFETVAEAEGMLL